MSVFVHQRSRGGDLTAIKALLATEGGGNRRLRQEQLIRCHQRGVRILRREGVLLPNSPFPWGSPTDVPTADDRERQHQTLVRFYLRGRSFGSTAGRGRFYFLSLLAVWVREL